MTRRLLRTTLCLALSVSALALTAPAHAAADHAEARRLAALIALGQRPPARPKPAQPVAANAFAARLVALTNIERRKAGVRPLTMHPCLNDGAQAWSTQMARTAKFNHQNLGWIGSRCGFRRMFGENIAKGYATPEQTMAGWMASPGHRENLLDPAYTHLGIGYTSAGGGYATQNFAA